MTNFKGSIVWLPIVDLHNVIVPSHPLIDWQYMPVEPLEDEEGNITYVPSEDRTLYNLVRYAFANGTEFQYSSEVRSIERTTTKYRYIGDDPDSQGYECYMVPVGLRKFSDSAALYKALRDSIAAGLDRELYDIEGEVLSGVEKLENFEKVVN